MASLSYVYPFPMKCHILEIIQIRTSFSYSWPYLRIFSTTRPSSLITLPIFLRVYTYIMFLLCYFYIFLCFALHVCFFRSSSVPLFFLLMFLYFYSYFYDYKRYQWVYLHPKSLSRSTNVCTYNPLTNFVYGKARRTRFLFLKMVYFSTSRRGRERAWALKIQCDHREGWKIRTT